MRTYLYHHFLSLSEIYILKNLCAEIWETKAHSSKIQLHLRFTLAIDSCSRPALRTPTPATWGGKNTSASNTCAPVESPAPSGLCTWVSRRTCCLVTWICSGQIKGTNTALLRRPCAQDHQLAEESSPWNLLAVISKLSCMDHEVMHAALKEGEKKEWHGHESTGEWRGLVLELDDDRSIDRSLDWISYYPLVKTMWHELHILVFCIHNLWQYSNQYLFVSSVLDRFSMYGSRHFNADDVDIARKMPPGGQKMQSHKLRSGLPINHGLPLFGDHACAHTSCRRIFSH